MERAPERFAGLDVHIAACVRMPGPRGGRVQHVETFGTTTAALLALRDWLEAHGVTHVAMESNTGRRVPQVLGGRARRTSTRA